MKIFKKKLCSITNILRSNSKQDYKDLKFNIAKSFLINRILTGNNSLICKENNIVVSLTTYSSRIYDVALSIESIGFQTYKPRKIILWLDEKEFSMDEIPLLLHMHCKRGLEIKFCKDFRSYKKIIPTLKLKLNQDIVTIDDDYIYPVDLLENLRKTSKKYPNTVIGSYAHWMKYDKYGNPLKYKKWDLYTKISKPSKNIFPVGAGGVLYPINIFHESVTNDKIFNDIAPYADDVWLKYMTLACGRKSKLIDAHKQFYDDFILIEKNQDFGLCKENFHGNRNDEQIRAVNSYLQSHIANQSE